MHSHTTADLVVRHARTIAGDSVDLTIRAGRIAAIAPVESASTPTLDASGHVLLPALVEAHVHLDKTLWGEPWRANTAGPDLAGFIANERRVLAGLDVPIGKRAGALLRSMIAGGSLHVRSHIDIAPDVGLRHVEAMLALREDFRGAADLQLVAFPQTGLLTVPGTAELMEAALKLGVETVGGLDPAGIDKDPIGQLRTIFAMAERNGSGIDIHLHDPGDLGVWQIERIADFTAGSGLAGRVMISHAYCLGMLSLERIEPVARRLADLRISLMTSAPADIAVPPVAFLRGHGVNVCCGSDGIRDAWSPMGNGDALERAWLLAYRFDWGKDHELLGALDAVTHSAARALGIADYGLEVGCPADFVLVKAENTQDAMVRRPHERIVVKAGRIVARDGAFIGTVARS